jgi:site-specific DNA-methyltransferase (adenine-specific)/modification methylase
LELRKMKMFALFKKDNINYIDIAKHRLFLAWEGLDKKKRKNVISINLIKEFEEK